MKRSFRVFDFKIFSSLVKFTYVYESIYKGSDTLNAYGKSMK